MTANANGSTSTPQTLVTIPPEYVEMLMLGAGHMLKHDVESVLQEDEKMRSTEYRFAEPEVQAARQEDFATAKRMLCMSSRILAAIGEEEKNPGQPISIEGDASELHWAVEEMARHVAGPRLQEALEGAPIPSEEVAFLTGALAWVLEEAPRLEREAIEENAKRCEAKRREKAERQEVPA